MIGHLNINSLRYKFSEVQDALQDRLLDCLAISETKLDDSFPSAQFGIQGHRVFRKDRNANGGGVMVFLRSDLPSRQLTELEHPHLESVAIECTINETKWIIHAMYRPPSGNATTFYNDFSKCLDETLTLTTSWFSVTLT